jgi:hypothetical protein
MDQPDPTQVASLDDLAWCLRHLRTLADTPTYRELERRTIHAAGMLPGMDLRRVPLKRATIADVLAGQAFPRKAFLLTFAEACGVDLRADHRWEQAWNRLAARYQVQPAPGGQVREHLATATQSADPDEARWDRAQTGPDRPQPALENLAQPGLGPASAQAAGTGTTGAQPWVLSDFLEAADAANGSAGSLLGRLVRREIERVTSFMRQLPPGGEITYDGEDREWLLGLAQEAQHSIDAISLSITNVMPHGMHGGLWRSDLGVRYLELQRQAIDRGVSIRRVFVLDGEDQARDELFLRIVQTQRDVGVDVRMLDFKRIPESLHGMIFEYVIFDDEVSYELRPGTSFNYDRFRPIIFRTSLVPAPSHVKDMKALFEQLWAAADPERQIGG